MLIQLPVPVLADLEIVGVAIMLALGIIGLLNNLFAAKKPQQPPAQGPRPVRPARPAQPAGDRISEEIEIFLEQITGKKPANKKPTPTASVTRPRRPAPSRKKPARPPQPQKPQPSKEPQRARPGSRISKRKVSDSSQLGEGVRSHISEHMEAGRITDQVATHLDHDVNEGVQHHLGVFGGEDAERFAMTVREPQETSIGARQIIELLRDPDGVRRAILINEILSPPRGSRRRS